MASPTTPQSTTLPTRSVSGFSTSETEAIPDEDSSETTKLFFERLQAWKHACAYLEDYIKASEKSESSSAKEYQKVVKEVSKPLKEGHHFDQQNGGIAGMFDNIRSNTQAISTSHDETAKALKGSVLPIFERLHSEVKNKTKELNKGAGKASKAVDKARNDSQKHIEMLGQYAASFDSRGGHVKPAEDPYLIQRQVYHRLHKQVIEENNNRDDMISVQNEFAQFEAHVLQTIQQGLQQFNQVMAHQADQQRNMYGDMAATASRIPPDFEWKGFLQRNNHLLVDPNGPKRSIENITFANQDHPSTRPLIAGSLERKGKLLKRYEAGYYVVTPSKYLHEFRSDDDFAKDPTPENTLYLPECLVGAVDGNTFTLKGKDQSKGAFNKMSMSHDYSFKAHTTTDARKWHDVIWGVSGGSTSSAPSSPAVGGDEKDTTSPVSPAGSQTTGTIAGAESEKTSTTTMGSPTTSNTTQGMQAEREVQGHPSETAVGNPAIRSDAAGPTGGQTESAKTNDYAPL